MKIVSAEQMRALDRAAIDDHGIDSLELMEKAGQGVANCVMDLLAGARGRVIIVSGRGNNGGDGIVAARLLAEAGMDVDVVMLAREDQLSTDACKNFQMLPAGIPVKTVLESNAINELKSLFDKTFVIVDAVLGTGLDREVEGLAKNAIELINDSPARVVSADLPSGLSANTGMAQGVAVKAQVTVTFGLPKRGLFIADGPGLSGQVKIVDIGIPSVEIDAIGSDLELITPSSFMDELGERELNSHKGTYGHVVVFAGSKEHLGAGYLAGLAALRSGCGLLTYCLPKGSFEKFDARYPEIMCNALPDEGSARFGEVSLNEAIEIAFNKNTIALGPAIGTSVETASFVNDLLKGTDTPAVVDADGLNVLNVEELAKRTSPTVLTPHPGEMARLMNTDTKRVQSDRIGFAKALAERTGATVVLKGYNTIVAEAKGPISVNSTGNAGMATAGMGDTLTGMISSFMAQGMNSRTASDAAVYLHGSAGDIAAQELGEASVIATDVIERIGRAIDKARLGK